MFAEHWIVEPGRGVQRMGAARLLERFRIAGLMQLAADLAALIAVLSTGRRWPRRCSAATKSFGETEWSEPAYRQ